HRLYSREVSGLCARGAARSLSSFAGRAPPGVEVRDLLDLGRRHLSGHVAHLAVAVVAPHASFEILELNDEIFLRHAFEPGRAELVISAAVACEARSDVTYRIAHSHQRRCRSLVVARGSGTRLRQRVVVGGDV